MRGRRVQAGVLADLFQRHRVLVRREHVEQHEGAFEHLDRRRLGGQLLHRQRGLQHHWSILHREIIVRNAELRQANQRGLSLMSPAAARRRPSALHSARSAQRLRASPGRAVDVVARRRRGQGMIAMGGRSSPACRRRSRAFPSTRAAAPAAGAGTPQGRADLDTGSLRSSRRCRARPMARATDNEGEQAFVSGEHAEVENKLRGIAARIAARRKRQHRVREASARAAHVDRDDRFVAQRSGLRGPLGSHGARPSEPPRRL